MCLRGNGQQTGSREITLALAERMTRIPAKMFARDGERTNGDTGRLMSVHFTW